MTSEEVLQNQHVPAAPEPTQKLNQGLMLNQRTQSTLPLSVLVEGLKSAVIVALNTQFCLTKTENSETCSPVGISGINHYI